MFADMYSIGLLWLPDHFEVKCGQVCWATYHLLGLPQCHSCQICKYVHDFSVEDVCTRLHGIILEFRIEQRHTCPIWQWESIVVSCGTRDHGSKFNICVKAFVVNTIITMTLVCLKLHLGPMCTSSLSLSRSSCIGHTVCWHLIRVNFTYQ